MPTVTSTRALLSVDLKKTAAVFLDLREEHRKDPRYMVSSFHSVLANVRTLQECARRNDVPLFHIATSMNLDAVRLIDPLLEGRSTFGDTLDPLSSLCPEVAPLGNETLIIKGQLSGFYGTNLAEELRRQGKEWLIFSGVWTDACVTATVNDAVHEGFKVILVKDACGSANSAMHQVSVLGIANRMFNGAVTDTAGACNLMLGRRIAAWQYSGAMPLRYNLENASNVYAQL